MLKQAYVLDPKWQLSGADGQQNEQAMYFVGVYSSWNDYRLHNNISSEKDIKIGRQETEAGGYTEIVCLLVSC